MNFSLRRNEPTPPRLMPMRLPAEHQAVDLDQEMRTAAREIATNRQPRTVATVHGELESVTQELAELLERASGLVELRQDLRDEMMPLIEADEAKWQAQLKALGELKRRIGENGTKVGAAG